MAHTAQMALLRAFSAAAAPREEFASISLNEVTPGVTLTLKDGYKIVVITLIDSDGEITYEYFDPDETHSYACPIIGDLMTRSFGEAFPDGVPTFQRKRKLPS